MNYLGDQLDKVARDIADQCPDSASKRDLIAYLQRISLYTHQVSLCQNLSDMLVGRVCQTILKLKKCIVGNCLLVYT